MNATATAGGGSWVVHVHGSHSSAEEPLKDDAVWMTDIEQSVESLDHTDEVEQWKKPSIYRVPPFIRDQKKTAFTPQVCSFGPYHHGHPQLSPAEEHKRRALVHFLKRSEKPLPHFTAAMAAVEGALQDSYFNLADEWKKDRRRFSKMMIMDGCFMLEVIRMRTPAYRKIYAENDPVFSEFGVHHMLPYLRRDMLVLENQLPLLVLKMLVMAERICPKPDCPFREYIAGDSRNDIVSDQEINTMVLNFFRENLTADISGLGLHPLHVFHRSLIYRSPPPAPATLTSKNINKRSSTFTATVRPAVELHAAGIQFCKSDTSCLMSITFSNGVLRLPFLMVHDATEYEFLNMIAFEHIHVSAGNGVTAYAFFMDQLVNTADDVKLLQENKILNDALGSEECIAKLINGLTREVTLKPEEYMEDVKIKINEYCQNPWYRWMAKLLRTHCENPWTALALMAAILVILLTAAQTAYSIVGYHFPKK